MSNRPARITQAEIERAIRAAKKAGLTEVEVRLGDETTKSGVAESDLALLAEGVAGLGNLELLGLMTIPPFLDDAENVRPYFSKLRELREDLVRRLGQPLPVLSMGMSHDFEIAIEEGATEIRVGTALFGERKAH